MSLGIIPKDSAYQNTTVKSSSGGSGGGGSSGSIVADKATIRSLTVDEIHGKAVIPVIPEQINLTAYSSDFVYGSNVDGVVNGARYGNVVIINFNMVLLSTFITRLFTCPPAFRSLFLWETNGANLISNGAIVSPVNILIYDDGEIYLNKYNTPNQINDLVIGTIVFTAPPLVL